MSLRELFFILTIVFGLSGHFLFAIVFLILLMCEQDKSRKVF